MNKQKTLNDSFSLSGKGLHTGLNLTVTFNPAPENYGYKIQRTDLPGAPIIDAVAENVTFENITVTNSTCADYQYYSGGIVGWVSGDNNKFINCKQSFNNCIDTMPYS